MSSTVVYLSMMSEEHTMQMWSNVVLNVHEMWNPKDVFDDHYETGDGPQGLTYCGICLANRWQMPHHFHFPSNTRRIISKSLKTCFEIEEFKMLGLCSRTAGSRNRQRIIKPAEQFGETLVLFLFVLICNTLCIKLLVLLVVEGKAGLFWGDSLLEHWWLSPPCAYFVVTRWALIADKNKEKI